MKSSVFAVIFGLAMVFDCIFATSAIFAQNNITANYPQPIANQPPFERPNPSYSNTATNTYTPNAAAPNFAVPNYVPANVPAPNFVSANVPAPNYVPSNVPAPNYVSANVPAPNFVPTNVPPSNVPAPNIVPMRYVTDTYPSATLPPAQPHANIPPAHNNIPLTSNNIPAANLEQLHATCAQKLHQARRAVALRDFAAAERIAREVQGINLQYKPTDDKPESVLALLKQKESLDESWRANGTTEQFKRHYAIFLLSQANALLNYGDVELATNLCDVALAQNVLYSESDVRAGLSPLAVARRIEDVKNYRAAQLSQQNNNRSALAQKESQPNNQHLSMATQRDIAKAIDFLKNARHAVDVGDFDDARRYCDAVRKMGLDDSLFPSNVDTPTKLLGEIAVKSNAVKLQQNRDDNKTTAGTNNNIHNAATNPTNTADNTPNMSTAVYNENKDTTQNIPATNLPDTTDFVDQARQARAVAIQQLGAEVIRMVSEANRLTNESRHEEAFDALNRARQRVDDAKVDEAVKISLYKSIENAVQSTSQHIEQNRSRINLDTQNKEVWAKLKKESDAARSKEQQIKTYVDECARLNEAQEYEQAVIIAKKAREFAPTEPVTQLLLQHTQMLANVRRSERNIADKREMFVEALHDVDESSIVSNDVFRRDIAYSSRWSDLKRRRKSTQDLFYERPESEKQIMRKLEMPISFSTDQPIAFSAFIDLLRAQTGLNIDVDWGALAEAYITTDSYVSLKLSSEIKLKNILNQVLGQKGLAYVVKNEMLNITSLKQARGQLITRSHYIGDVVMPIRNFDGSSPHDMRNIINRSIQDQSIHRPHHNTPQGNAPMQYPNTGGYIPTPALGNTFGNNTQNYNLTPGMINAQTFSSGVPNPNGTATFANNAGALTPEGAAGGGGADYEMVINLIKNVTSYNENADDGANIVEFEGNMSIIVRQTEEVHAEIADLLNQLRKLSDLQIAVEVRYITISDDYYEKMGVDFQMKLRNDGAANKVELYSGSGSSSSSTDTTDTSTSSSSSSATGIARGNNVTVGLQGPSQFQFDLSIPFSQNTYGLADPMYGGFNPDSGLRMGFALLSDIEAYFFMSATQGDSRTNVLQAPKVMIFNGQMGSVVDSTQSPFVTSVVPVVGDFAVAYQPIISVLSEGQIMTVQGTVSPNRQYVRLTLQPQFTVINKVVTYRYVGDENTSDSTTSTGTTSDGASATADERRAVSTTSTRQASGVTIQQPIYATFSVQTTVTVPDGGTIFMGGIKRLREGRIEAGTPILDKIPYLNRLFMNTAIGRDTSSILMVVTPRIIIQEEEEEFLTGVRP
jgi:general secretion pathway protein D